MRPSPVTAFTVATTALVDTWSAVLGVVLRAKGVPEMPGGYLSFGIYQKLGGEREFGAFWLHLGLPTIVACAACWLLVAQVAHATTHHYEISEY